MCLCKGTGGIRIKHKWGVQFEPCPDTNCKFDRNEADRKYEEWKKKWEKQLKEDDHLNKSA